MERLQTRLAMATPNIEALEKALEIIDSIQDRIVLELAIYTLYCKDVNEEDRRKLLPTLRISSKGELILPLFTAYDTVAVLYSMIPQGRHGVYSEIWECQGTQAFTNLAEAARTPDKLRQDISVLKAMRNNDAALVRDVMRTTISDIGTRIKNSVAPTTDAPRVMEYRRKGHYRTDSRGNKYKVRSSTVKVGVK